MNSSHKQTIVTDTIHIGALLGRLHKNHCSVEIKAIDSFNNIESLGLSEILDFNLDDNNIFFDALQTNKVTTNQRIKAFTKYNGIDIHFDSIITDTIERNHCEYFNTNIPNEIIHKQRRQQYRAVLQNLWKIPVTLVDKSLAKPLSAYIYNISTGGISVRSSTEEIIKIKDGMIIDTLIQLPDNRKIESKLQVRQTLTNKAGGFQQLAGQFIDINPKQERMIQSFVNKVERRNITSQSQLHSTE